MTAKVPRKAGRRVFGVDPAAYDRARLPYPGRVYKTLQTRCGLVPGTAVFEVGAGTGIATRQLLRLGARPITIIEPDRRMAAFLLSTLGGDRSRVAWVPKPFEQAGLAPGTYDLGVAATSFHWVPERLGLRKVARALRPGGWWASWGNQHGDPTRRSPFHEAIQPLYRQLHGSVNEPARPSSLRHARVRRLAALESVDRFDRISSGYLHWTATLSAEHITELWSTFSDVLSLPLKKRAWFLSEFRRVAEEQFGGRVKIPILTPLTTARRT